MDPGPLTFPSGALFTMRFRLWKLLLLWSHSYDVCGHWILIGPGINGNTKLSILQSSFLIQSVDILQKPDWCIMPKRPNDSKKKVWWIFYIFKTFNWSLIVGDSWLLFPVNIHLLPLPFKNLVPIDKRGHLFLSLLRHLLYLNGGFCTEELLWRILLDQWN